MRFGNGNTYWQNRKSNNGGRPPAEITEKIFVLGAKCLAYMEEIMARPNSERAKLEVTKIIMGKLAPDLTAEIGEEWMSKCDERTKQFIARRLGYGDKGLHVVTAGPEANGTTGGV